MNLSIMRTCIIGALSLFIFGKVSLGQTNSFEKDDKELAALYSKIFPFYYSNPDSLNYYSDSFTTRFTSFIKGNPATLKYRFNALIDSNACGIVTTKDGLFRIYSWDTWLGGTMHRYKNLYQFRSGNKVRSVVIDYGDEDMGTYYEDVYSLKANGKTYILSIYGGSESTKDAYKAISIFSISNDTLNNKEKLIKTKSGLTNSIMFEYDFFSVVDRPERPLRLIKYDEDKKIIYIPIVLENGKVIDKYILYQFSGQYFEKVPTPH
jgi:hypothetical protein